jgi:hypothetical protein
VVAFCNVAYDTTCLSAVAHRGEAELAYS